MFSHIVVGSNDLEEARRFYDAVFGAAYGIKGETDPKGRLVYAHDGARLMVTKPIDGRAATFANGGTIGLVMQTPDQVDAWHKAGIEAGGTTAEDPPGIRTFGKRELYLAYLRDPTGNKLCARAVVSAG